jgi:hypothetical protein
MSTQALLSTLLPGDAHWPAAGTLDLALETALLAPILAALPENFAPGDEAALEAVERAQPEAFAALVHALYVAYYTHPSVRAVLAARAGHEARPPQPLGHELAPFDPVLLEPQRARQPFWRDPK